MTFPRSPLANRSSNSRTAANTTPSLNSAILAMGPGTTLDELVERSVLRGTVPGKGRGCSSSWDGARAVINRLNSMGYVVRIQVQAELTFCEVLKPSQDEAMSEIAAAEAFNFPEAVAKAAILACIHMEAKVPRDA